MVVALWWALVLAVHLSWCPCWGRAICPSRCSCQDDSASCLDAQLEVLPIQFNPQVQTIDLRGNRISNVHYTLNIYSRLVHLDVSQNRITSLGTKNFEAQSKLKYLNASRNHIGSLGKDIFRGLGELKILDLSHNHLETIDGGCLREASNLIFLDLSYNKITSFEDPSFLKAASKIQTILLVSNQILDIPSAVLKHLPGPCKLETLALSDNLIETVEENAFPGPCAISLKNLSLGSNVIKSIDKAAFNPLHNLEKLDLSYNNLTIVPTHELSKLGKLSELDLSGNMFTEVKPVGFQSLFQLKKLKMNSLTFLQRIDSRAFVDNIWLETVEIEDNPLLIRIPPRIFHGNPHLAHVSLKGNSLQTVDASHFPLDKLKSLDLSENPLNCNCSLLWLWTLTQLDSKAVGNESERLVLSTRGLVCGGPQAMRGTLIKDVPESVVRCETTWLTVAVVTALVLALFGATCVVLLMFNDKKFCWCHRDKQTPPAEPRRLAPAGLHAVGSPTPILMLMPDKHFPDDFVKPWPPDPRHNEYSPDLTATNRKQPHVVYV